MAKKTEMQPDEKPGSGNSQTFGMALADALGASWDYRRARIEAEDNPTEGAVIAVESARRRLALCADLALGAMVDELRTTVRDEVRKSAGR